MYIHREGFRTIVLSALAFVVLGVGEIMVLHASWPVLSVSIFIVLLVVLFLVVWFFRIPNRQLTQGENFVVCPADGKIVAVELCTDEEYFHDKRLQVSVFMSPLNVHQNRYPLSGQVVYSRHHPGKFLAAFDPKSSTQNERHSVVVDTGKHQILVKQIAGAVARRIVNYARVGHRAVQNEELGFIRFGSRVDILLPPQTKIHVKMGQKVVNGKTVIGTLP